MYLSDFSLLLTPTACNDTEWASAVVVIVVIVVDVAGRGNNGFMQRTTYILLSFSIATSPGDCHAFDISNHL